MSEESLSEANLNPLARTRSSDSVGTQGTQGTQSTRYTDDPEFDDVIRNYREPELECADEEFTSPKIEREPLVTSTPDEFDGLFEDISSFTATQLLEAENGPPDSGTSLGKRTSSELSGSSMRPYKAWKASHPSPPDSPSHTIGTEIVPIVITPPDCSQLPTIISLPWGVQWELARIAKGLFNKTSDNRAHLDHILKSLHGQSNKVAAPKVPRIVKCLDAKDPLSEWSLAKDDPGDKRATLETEVKSPWSELDVEESILKKHQFGCLGCNETNPDIIAAGADTPHWYGGKVNFAATLVEKNRNFSISLEKPFLSSSSRFYRRFGSSRFIRVSIPKTLVFGSGSSVIKFFQSPVIIWNHVFRAFYHKDHTVFLFQTNEQYQEGKVVTPDGPSAHGLSFLDFLSWHNDLEVNHNQSMAKWAARLALGLSNSIPVMRIDPKNYHLIDDIYSPMHDLIRDGKAPSNMEMTDGCGLANAAFFKVIQQRLGLDHSPTAVQCRLQGMKGLFLLHPDHINSAVGEPTVWVRPSQTKIRYHPEVLVDPDPALFTLDLLRTSHMSSPARLSGETIVNMAENGVHSGVFINLMKEQLWECVEKLIFWASDVNNGVTRKAEDVLRLLRANVEKDGSVPRVLLARQNPGTARAYGFVADDLRKDKNQELELDDEDDMGEMDKVFPEESMAWWPDPNSGCPSALHETVLTLLDAGFSPSENDYLRNKLREVVRMAITRHTNKFHFDVMHSCTAFIVPDPCGVLEPGEVHIKSSYHNLQNQEGNMTDIILGDVLLTRHPCKVPTDVQKATAVFKKELILYTDVIVISVKGHKVKDEILGRHLASMTGGGDYDGDKMQAFWDPELLKDFKPADPKSATEPARVQAALVTENITVPTVLETMKPQDGYLNQILVLQKHLLRELVNASLVGNYSKMWEHSIYQNGYHHDDTIYLAYMFCQILDGSKTGVTADPAQFQRDKKRFHFDRILDWKQDSKKTLMAGANPRVLRGSGLSTFVMDHLKAQRTNELDNVHKKLDKVFPKAYTPHYDLDLAKYWKDALERAEEDAKPESPTNSKKRIIARERLNDLKLIKKKIEELGEKYRSSCIGEQFTSLSIETRQDRLRAMSKLFASTPEQLETFTPGSHDLELIKASCAYVHEFQRTRGYPSQLPYSVAMKHLCYMKAVATGSSKTLCAWIEPALHTHKAWVSGSGKLYG